MSDLLAWLVIPLAYLWGSIPTGVIIGRLTRGIDVRAYGSGSSGATNVARTLGPAAGAIVLLLDGVKGAVPILAVRLLGDSPYAFALAGSAVILGHTFPVLARFRGGKGVATGAGALFAASPIAGLTAVTTGAAVAALTRYVSLGSLVGTLLGTAVLISLAAVFNQQLEGYLIFGLVGALLIIGRHIRNIERLIRGQELRFGMHTPPRRVGAGRRDRAEDAWPK